MKHNLVLFLCILGLVFACNETSKNEIKEGVEIKNDSSAISGSTYLIILGTVQDAGAPHIACEKECCSSLFTTPDPNRKVVSLGLIDDMENKKYLFEATPDISTQLRTLKNFAGKKENNDIPNGIFLSHAHIGHYTGLMYLGKEAANTKEVAVYAMPQMKSFLTKNGPWNQLVSDKNIAFQETQDRQTIRLSKSLKVTPFLVPHRDEYSETVGYLIEGPKKKALFIPDINKWNVWDTSIIAQIAKVDYAFIDATFYDGEELNNRDMDAIPHPFVVESLSLFEKLPLKEKNKIHFIHLNHTNPLLNVESPQFKFVGQQGFHIAQFGAVFNL